MKFAIAAALIVFCIPLRASQDAWWRHSDSSAAIRSIQGDGRTRGPRSAAEQVAIQIPTPAAAPDVPSAIHITGEYILGALLAVIGVLVKKQIKVQEDKNKEYDEHIKQSAVGAVSHGKLEVKVDALEARCGRMETTMDRVDSKLDRLLDR